MRRKFLAKLVSIEAFGMLGRNPFTPPHMDEY